MGGDAASDRGTVEYVVPGPGAVEALAAAVASAKEADVFAPVTVLTASAHVAVMARRALARRAGGLAHVSWLSVPQLVDRLAARRAAEDPRPRLDPLVRRALVRAALATAAASSGADATGTLARVAANPLTEESFERTLAELADLGSEDLSALAAFGPRERSAVAVIEDVRRRSAAFLDDADLLAMARAAAVAGDASVTSLGALVRYLPDVPTRAESDLYVALAARIPVHSIEFDPFRTEVPVPEGDRTRFVRAPDPDEEVRVVTRQVLATLAAGVAPDDVAVVFRVAEPYALLVHETFDAAGIPHHGPGLTTLAQSAAGRLLLGFLRVHAAGWPRTHLFRWVRSAPVRGPDGERISSRLDRIARRAGVATGLDQWQDRLARHGAEHPRDLETVEQAAALVEWLASLGEPPAQDSWAAWADWGVDRLRRLAGGGRNWRHWSEADQDAREAVEAVLAGLSALDAVESAPDAARFGRVLEQELGRSVHGVGRFGHGVFVGPLGDIVGAPHRLVAVLGMGEGRFPPRIADDPLVPDAARRAVGAAARPRRRALADEERDLAGAVAAGDEVILSFARADTRSQREVLPARAFLRTLAGRAGGPIGSDDLTGLGGRVASFTDVPSFQAGLAGAPIAIDAAEQATASLLGIGPGRRTDPRSVVEADPVLGRGRDAVADRVAGRFGPWLGEISPEHTRRFADGDLASATSIEEWATCPFRYFLSQVLRVRPYDEFADADSISGRDRGSLVHAALEQFVRERGDRAPTVAWASEDVARLRAIIAELGDAYESAGRTGRPVLWELRRDELVRNAEAILERDARHRRDAHVTPVAVEFAFGPPRDADGAAASTEGAQDGGGTVEPTEPWAPPVGFALEDGREVRFRGMVDRVDRDPDTGRLVVIDYKTGPKTGYRGLGEDITLRGTHMQLVIYAEAARQQFGGDDVEAWYWFLDHGDHKEGGAIDEQARARFDDVLRVVVGGIEGGIFPARPGADDFFRGFANCAWCDYERVCPRARGEQWEEVRLAERVRPYTMLAEGDPTPGPDGLDTAGASS